MSLSHSIGKILLLAMMLANCSSPSTVETGGGAATQSIEPVQGELQVISPEDQLPHAQYFIAQGDNANFPLRMSQGNVADFSIGFSVKHPSLRLNGGQLSVSGVPAGAYNATLVARHRRNCEALKIKQCEINDQQVQSSYPSTDLQGSVVITVVDLASLNPQGVGSGGGLMGQILRGEGLIGSLAKSFIGDKFSGAGAAGAGAGGTQPAQGQGGGSQGGF
jgi:hypothetical protein